MLQLAVTTRRKGIEDRAGNIQGAAMLLFLWYNTNKRALNLYG